MILLSNRTKYPSMKKGANTEQDSTYTHTTHAHVLEHRLESVVHYSNRQRPGGRHGAKCDQPSLLLFLLFHRNPAYPIVHCIISAHSQGTPSLSFSPPASMCMCILRLRPRLHFRITMAITTGTVRRQQHVEYDTTLRRVRGNERMHVTVGWGERPRRTTYTLMCHRKCAPRRQVCSGGGTGHA